MRIHRTTLRVGEALVVYSSDEVRVLRIDGVKATRIQVRLQDQTRDVAGQEQTDVHIAGHRIGFRLAFRDSHQPYVEAMFETPPEGLMAVREARLTYPELFVPPRPDLPTPIMFNWSVGEVLRFKGPDASMITLKLTKVPKGQRRKFKLELNKNATERLLYETWRMKLSGEQIRFQVQPGATEETLRLFAVAPPAIVAFGF